MNGAIANLTHTDFDLLPDLQDLIERVADGSLDPKNLDNEAGRIRIKIAKLKEALAQLPTEEGIADQEREIEDLRETITKKRGLVDDIYKLGKSVLAEGADDGDSTGEPMDLVDTPPTASVREDTGAAVLAQSRSTSALAPSRSASAPGETGAEAAATAAATPDAPADEPADAGGSPARDSDGDVNMG
ncbi:RNA polymerase II transcription mediator complex subunit 9-domain-containing protein [Dipodascopsis tothii]|uniref:RNA polymerase II transcription mediator complex subunit 9-domain-containing protein n=1 Tax=Dipodascopsis tothii TaxID=44089 RepID=UPI0034CED257